jgi:hypothetical protein
MNIGDRVRMLHAREEGVITRFLDNKLVEVEIEDGFRIPVLRSELVVVAAEEASLFRRETPKPGPKAPVTPEISATSGVYMAFVILNDVDLALYLVNNTDLEVPFTFGEAPQSGYKGLLAGSMKKRSSTKITEVSTRNFENWPVYVVQLLFFGSGVSTLREPLTRKMRFRANTFFKSKQKAPVLAKDAYLFQLDADAVALQPDKLVEGMTGSAKKPPADATFPLTPPEPEVDLHLEKLGFEGAQVAGPEILQMQLNVFENALERAIAGGMPEITFIHGVGNGVLRNEIHKRLGKNPHVAFFKDARKEKFGYGATLVKLK